MGTSDNTLDRVVAYVFEQGACSVTDIAEGAGLTERAVIAAVTAHLTARGELMLLVSGIPVGPATIIMPKDI